jgi:hypothetical protein
MPIVLQQMRRRDDFFDLEFFENFRAFTDGYKQNSAALKYLRHMNEDEINPFASHDVFLRNDQPIAVAACHHHPGTEFEFDPHNMRDWSWQEMVAQLDDPSRELVVKGAGGNNEGLTGCSFCVRPNSYDHMRHAAAVAAGTQEGPTVTKPMWDFVIHRSDGTGIRLHPNWSNTKVMTFEVAGHAAPVQPPRGGLGGTDGPGTFRRYREIANQQTLRFQATRRKAKGKAKAKAAPFY